MGGGEIISGVLSGGERLDKALAQASELSRERVKALIAEGRVLLAGKPAAQASAKAADGARFRIDVPPAAPAAAAAQAIPLVVAKSDAAHEGLARQFAAHDLERAYLAVCNGHPRPASGTIAGRIGRSDANRKKMAVLAKESSRGKHAVTHYKVVRELVGASLVECRLETGRTHQVRVHLASIGHALLGDPLYGRPNPQVRDILKRLNFRRQALHAAVLGFLHPITSDRLRFVSDLPPDMKELIDETGHSNR